tara:strand:- start:101 stop:289 length:189 start_codon:yes stop_codon:yes gene_type:complete
MDIEKIVEKIYPEWAALIIGLIICSIFLFFLREFIIWWADVEQERVFGIFCEKLAEGTLTCS